MGHRADRTSSRSVRAALWLAAACLAACEPVTPPAEPRAEPPAAPPAAADGAGRGAGAEVLDAGADASDAGASDAGAVTFDAGDVKPVAEYLREPRFAAADLERGELLSLACQPCHTFGAGEPNLLGPNLHGVFGRMAAAQAEFAYSDALKRSGIVWTPRTLEAWLADPAGFVDGTSMGFGGYRSATDRRDLLAYLMIATSATDDGP
jgi:cytochrome c